VFSRLDEDLRSRQSRFLFFFRTKLMSVYMLIVGFDAVAEAENLFANGRYKRDNVRLTSARNIGRVSWIWVS